MPSSLQYKIRKYISKHSPQKQPKCFWCLSCAIWAGPGLRTYDLYAHCRVKFTCTWTLDLEKIAQKIGGGGGWSMQAT